MVELYLRSVALSLDLRGMILGVLGPYIALVALKKLLMSWLLAGIWSKSVCKRKKKLYLLKSKMSCILCSKWGKRNLVLDLNMARVGGYSGSSLNWRKTK